ncbi:histidine phosphatase family protein [Streptomyces sp. NBC_01795]|uniref:histidine phosphatase family protein n=1 Tax=unclassified Streptomyces TaxID=2593676 RepID=UPI002DD89FB3|nr:MULTISPECIES: histidine phosphatase family protein [unclassified Streptomyces]WSA90929.1 histidine phosphatase family protein [Streptomyces sp. NBC_01795]WSB75252.1 histidine phosphatase family protein [Streptomyces sp. NBC_01775]WSS16464.1 histidine phosphatase family protein [Streptomyces sp. NBC_01186]
MSARLLLVRHGQTVWHAENRYCGSSDVALTEAGERQAEALGRWSAGHAHEYGIQAVACSPLARARRTAAPSARALGLEPAVHERLRETDFGWGEGRTIAEMTAEDPGLVRAFQQDAERGAFPGSEPPAAVAERVCGALRELAAAYEGGTVLVVAHNTAFRIALCALLGIPLGRYRQVLPRLDNAAVTQIELDGGSGGRAALRSLNVPTGELPPAASAAPEAHGIPPVTSPR